MLALSNLREPSTDHSVNSLLLLFLCMKLDSAPNTSVPGVAIEAAQTHLVKAQADGSVPEDVKLGESYVTLAMSPRRVLDFLRSENPDPSSFVIVRSSEVRVFMVRADSCFSSIGLYREGDTFHALGRLRYEPDPIDLMVYRLLHDFSGGFHRVWVFDSPFPTPCQTIIAEKKSGERLAFVFDRFTTQVPRGFELEKLGEPVGIWGTRLKNRLRLFHGIDLAAGTVSSAPGAATRIAESHKNDWSVRDRAKLFGVEGPETLGDPLVQYWLSPVEALLYAESDENDPRAFDADPIYSYPVLMEGEVVATVNVRRIMQKCDQNIQSDSTWTYEHVGFSLPGRGQFGNLFPSHLAARGDVAIVEIADVDRWYYVAGADSAWMVRYYPRGSSHRPQPVSEAAKFAKESIRNKFAD